MCTVTFIRANDTFFFTSSRDETVQRGRAIPPKIYKLDEALLLFPKDTDAGGTWTVVRDNSNTGVLINGAFKNHLSQPPYKRSRGLILIDILAAPVPVVYFSQMNLQGIEPFTIILFQEFVLYECRWDGLKKYKKQLSNEKNHIWSSVTLYDEKLQRKREGWFARWLGSNPQPSLEDIFRFHQSGGDGDVQNDIRMNRDGYLFTVSITGIQMTGEISIMRYLDLKDGSAYSKKLHHSTSYIC